MKTKDGTVCGVSLLGVLGAIPELHADLARKGVLVHNEQPTIMLVRQPRASR